MTEARASAIEALSCTLFSKASCPFGVRSFRGYAQNVIPQPPLLAPGPVGKAQNVIAETPPRPDDKSAIALDCSGLLQGWNNCLLTASKTCGTRGYTILDCSDQRPPIGFGVRSQRFGRSLSSPLSRITTMRICPPRSAV